ncbi:MAG: hypothetical protein OCC49_15170 [Fibrobacterales bacterium]
MELSIINWTALMIAVTHTFAGPDHYLPFVLISKARQWTLKKTLFLATLCGIIHVISSVLLGFVGIQLGAMVETLIGIESVRGELAAWGLISFGFIYGSWGLRKSWKSRHTHSHTTSTTITPWVLFIIFALGPCEPLIPILMYPAFSHGTLQVILVASVFGFFTLSTMLTMVWLMYKGVHSLRFGFLEKYSHAIAGYTICLSGAAVMAIGL